MAESTPIARLAEVIRATMKNKGVSQDALEALTGIPQATLSRRLTGRVSFTVEELYAVADALGVAPGELVTVAAA